MPKNKQVRSTITVLRDMNLPVASYGALDFFESVEAQAFLRILRIINKPIDGVSLSLSFLINYLTFYHLKPMNFWRNKICVIFLY